MRLIFDIETDGFLESLSVLHSLVIKDAETGEMWSCCDNDHPMANTIQEGLHRLMDADQIIGHNIIKFDLPAIQKVYPWFTYDEDKVLDTLTMSRLIWTAIVDTDQARIKRGTTTLTPKLAGSHGLEAWGHRLGQWKGDYSKIMEARGLDPWSSWNPEMQEYCEQDVEVNHALLKLIEEKDCDPRSVKLEHQVAFILAAQERAGFRFDVPAAEKLLVELMGIKAELNDSLASIFEPWEVDLGEFIPKRPNSKLGYTGHYEIGEDGKKVFVGDPVRKTKTVVFNPNSRDHIADRLKAIYGWKAKDFTPSGKPKVDEDVLDALPYPEAKQLARYMLIQKRIGQLAEGRQAWLKHVTPAGRIHGGIIPNGAVTGRATHSNPNIGQVPKVGTEFGAQCRGLFTATPGKTKLLGCDVSGLELRMLGHFMARHDGGAYAEIVINGDVHSANAAALNGMTVEDFLIGKVSEDPVESITGQIEDAYKWLRKKPKEEWSLAKVKDYYKYLRETAKTFIYAFLYGAGNAKIGSIVGGGAKIGAMLKEKFFKQFPALKKLIDGVTKAAEANGFLKGLDGRKLHVRSAHSALNTLLQSAGAIVCKQWMVEFHRLLKERGLDHLVTQVAWVHDELQMEIDLSLVETCPETGKLTSVIGDICIEAIAVAGEKLGIRVPLTGEYAIGDNWMETH
jgi:ethanolamine utilization microcompartment shell protein EutS